MREALGSEGPGVMAQVLPGNRIYLPKSMFKSMLTSVTVVALCTAANPLWLLFRVIGLRQSQCILLECHTTPTEYK